MAKLMVERQVWVTEEADVPEGPHMALIAPAFSNYPEGTIVDLLCVTHGRCFAGHGDDDECHW